MSGEAKARGAIYVGKDGVLHLAFGDLDLAVGARPSEPRKRPDLTALHYCLDLTRVRVEMGPDGVTLTETARSWEEGIVVAKTSDDVERLIKSLQELLPSMRANERRAVDRA